MGKLLKSEKFIPPEILALEPSQDPDNETPNQSDITPDDDPRQHFIFELKQYPIP